jgi:hypothetical protein
MMATGIWGIGLIKQGGLLRNEVAVVEISGGTRLLLIKPYDSCRPDSYLEWGD